MSNFDELYDLVLMEKETRQRYRESQFKKQHDYDPKTKTINVNNERYKVDMNINDPLMDVDAGNGMTDLSVRRLSAETSSDDPTIHLDKNFFRLKDNKRREAVLQHEVGHTKMHSTNPDSNKLDDDFVSKRTILKLAANQGLDISDPKIVKAITNDPDVKKYLSKEKNGPVQSERKQLIKILNKYAKGGHSDTDEFEADRYAANRTSEKHLKRGLRESYKHLSSDKGIKEQIDGINAYYGAPIQSKDKKNVDNLKKQQNKLMSEDYISRSKALKDKEVRKSKIYKPTKESVLLDIYESEQNGTITEEEMNFLLQIIN